MNRLCLVFLTWIPTAFAQTSSVHDSTLVLSPPLVSQTGLYPAQETAWTYTLTGTFVPVGAGIVLIAADPTNGDGDVLLGTLLIGGGLLIGPSLGHLYLGDARRAWIGTGIRGGGVALGMAAGYYASRNSNEWFAGVSEFFWIALAGYVAGTAYNFATIDDSVRERGLAVGPGVGPNGAPVLTVSAWF